jgi:hypothetical protein
LLLVGSEKLDATAGRGGKPEPKPPKALPPLGAAVTGAAEGKANEELKEAPGAAELAPNEKGAGAAVGATVAGGANENPDELAAGADGGAPNTMGAGVMEKAFDTAAGAGALVTAGAGVDPNPPNDTLAGARAATAALVTGIFSSTTDVVLLVELSLEPYLAVNSDVYLM